MGISDRDLAVLNAALAKRGVTDLPAALRRLMGTTDKPMMGPDPAMAAKLQGWTTGIQAEGAVINQIAHQPNEAKLRDRHMPYTAEDAATIRAMAFSLVAFVDGFLALWVAKQTAVAQEVDKALAGLDARAETAESVAPTSSWPSCT